MTGGATERPTGASYPMPVWLNRKDPDGAARCAEAADAFRRWSAALGSPPAQRRSPNGGWLDGPWSGTAALLSSIVKNQALVEGNERLGWFATAVLLDINGIDISVASNDDVYKLMIDVTAGSHTCA